MVVQPDHRKVIDPGSALVTPLLHELGNHGSEAENQDREQPSVQLHVAGVVQALDRARLGFGAMEWRF